MTLKEVLEMAPQYGLAAGALLIVYKIVSNHINHNTEALKDLSVAVAKLTTWLEARER